MLRNGQNLATLHVVNAIFTNASLLQNPFYNHSGVIQWLVSLYVS